MRFTKQKSESIAVAKGIKAKELPSISRVITEVLSASRKVLVSRLFIASCVSVPLLVLIGWEGTQLVMRGKRLQYVLEERGSLSRQVVAVEQAVEQHQNYRDAYFAEALLDYRLGDWNKSRLSLEKVLQIDPNFTPGRELSKLLEEK